jgi:hypothetical protein
MGRSRAAARCSGLGTRHGCAGRVPPTSRSTAARPPIGGRTRRQEGLQRHHLPPRRSSTDERGRLDLLRYGSAEEPLDGGTSTHQRVRAPVRRPRAAPSPGELRSAARHEKAQMNPRVSARVSKPVLFDRNPHVAVGCRWTTHV